MNIKEYIKDYWSLYALYTIQSRGIPNRIDSLTPVQRLSLVSVSNKYEKTKSVIGKVIENGYHHSDASLEKALSRLAKKFGVAEGLLEGDGFFGTQISPNPAAARYTSVRINEKFSKILSEMKSIRKKDSDDAPLPLPISYPIGLSIGVQGVAVGYASLILPRKIEDIQSFMDGKIKEVLPYFNGFQGNITRLSDKDFLIEGKYDTDGKKHVHIQSYPPVRKWKTFTEKLLNKIEDVSNLYQTQILVDDFSKNAPDLKIYIKKENEDIISDLVSFISEELKVKVKESVLFVDEKGVINYSSVEDYLNDFNVIRYTNIGEKQKSDISELEKEVLFLRIKRDFILFLSEQKRTDVDIKKFLDSVDIEFQDRLKNVKIIESSVENISIRIENEISEILKNISLLSTNSIKNEKKLEASKKVKFNTISPIVDDSEDYLEFIEKEEEVVENEV